MTSISDFTSRLHTLLEQAAAVDTATLPRLDSYFRTSDTTYTERTVAHAIGMVLTSLCGRLPFCAYSLPGSRITPQFQQSIKLALSWCLAYLQQPDCFVSGIITQINDDPDYITFLHQAWADADINYLIGIITMNGYTPDFSTDYVARANLQHWAQDTLLYLLAFCAARDINPY